MKKQVLKLDLDDLEDSGEDLVHLFFHTSVPGYVFVDDINHLYNLSLCRQNDLELDEQRWPLYTYHDTLRQLDYYLIERPGGAAGIASHWAPGHKMMVLKGENALETAKRMYNDFSTPPPLPDECNPTETEQYNILTSYQQAFTPVTIYDFNAPATTSKKMLKERNELEVLFATILDLLDP